LRCTRRWRIGRCRRSGRPDFTLTAQDGGQVSLSSFHGRVAAVIFVYTRCRTKCPTLTPTLSMVQDQLGERLWHAYRVLFRHARPGARHARSAEVVRRSLRGQCCWVDVSHRVTGRYSRACRALRRGRAQEREMAKLTTHFSLRSLTDVGSCACNMSACSSTRRSLCAIS
jgi:hypothetical protein